MTFHVSTFRCFDNNHSFFCYVVLEMKWIRPAVVKISNLRALPSLNRGFADTRVFLALECLLQVLARNIPNPSPSNVFPGDLVVVENPNERNKLLIRRVKCISSSNSSENYCVYLTSENEADVENFGPIPMHSVLGRACYYYNNDQVRISQLFIDVQNHGPIENNHLSHLHDSIYVSHAESFFV